MGWTGLAGIRAVCSGLEWFRSVQSELDGFRGQLQRFRGVPMGLDVSRVISRFRRIQWCSEGVRGV